MPTAIGGCRLPGVPGAVPGALSAIRAQRWFARRPEAAFEPTEARVEAATADIDEQITARRPAPLAPTVASDRRPPVVNNPIPLPPAMAAVFGAFANEPPKSSAMPRVSFPLG